MHSDIHVLYFSFSGKKGEDRRHDKDCIRQAYCTWRRLH